MSERPFMQLYVSDYLGDTRHLSTEQHGAYLLLLMTMWNAGGELPDDDAKLARIVGLTTKKWRSVKGDVMAFFEVVDGVVRHHRLTKELHKSERQSDLRAAAGAKGAAAKSMKNNQPAVANAVANGVAMLKHSPEPYRKKRASNPNLTDGAVWLDRWSDEALFKACEEVRGEKSKSFLQRDVFNAATVEKAKALLSARLSAGATDTDMDMGSAA